MPSETYIAAYDGSPASRAAVQFAVELAGVQDAEVSAVHVYPRVTHTGLRGGVFDTDLQSSLQESGRAIMEGLDVDGVDHRVLALGSPAQALHELAEQEGAALLVVGSTHHGQVGRVVVGSVASKLLHGAPCPVLVVPADRAQGPIQSIAVAYDEGPQASAALREAERLARLFGARLQIVAAHESHVYAGPVMVATTELDEVLRGDLAARVQERADAISGIDVEIHVTTGPATQAVVRVAQGADLLVTGSRGYGPLHSVLVGSVSRYLVDHSPCPVLVVPRVADEALDDEPQASDSVAEMGVR
jgi:nucleotide-binding universal stress UspA family protein